MSPPTGPFSLTNATGLCDRHHQPMGRLGRPLGFDSGCRASPAFWQFCPPAFAGPQGDDSAATHARGGVFYAHEQCAHALHAVGQSPGVRSVGKRGPLRSLRPWVVLRAAPPGGSGGGVAGHSPPPTGAKGCPAVVEGILYLHARRAEPGPARVRPVPLPEPVGRAGRSRRLPFDMSTCSP